MIKMINERWLSERFKETIQNNGFKILSELSKESPDFIISANGKRIGAELKGDAGSNSLATAIGQLLFGKTVFNVDELWLVIPSLTDISPSISKEWFDTFKSSGIRIFSLQDNSLVEIKEDMIDPSNRFVIRRLAILKQNNMPFPLSKRMEQLVRLVKQKGEASFSDLTKGMGLTGSGFRSLLAMTLKRTNILEKFRRNNTKWLRIKQIDALNEQTIDKID